MWLIFRQLSIIAGWEHALNVPGKNPQLGSQFHAPTATGHKYDKTQLRIDYQRESNFAPPDWKPVVIATTLSSAVSDEIYNILYTHP